MPFRSLKTGSHIPAGTPASGTARSSRSIRPTPKIWNRSGWVYQVDSSLQNFEATPLVVDGIEAVGYGGVIAIDPHTGNREWTYTMTDVTDSGILKTDSNVLSSGGREGYFQALDAKNGHLLWKTNLGGQMAAGPISYQVDGKQYVVIAAGHALFAFRIERLARGFFASPPSEITIRKLAARADC